MLNHLVEGMREAGAEVEVVHLREKKIENCVGCFTCWTKTPGKCFQKDDMTDEIFPKLLASDLVVLATPLYYHFMNGAMRIFIERTLPAAQPFFERSKGKTYHPLRYKVPASVILSVCGFPEESEFDALSEFLNRTRHKDLTIAAEIYRPDAGSMTNPFLKDKINDVLNATKLAGRELVESMKISPETMEKIRQPLVEPQTFADMGNIFFKTCIAEGVTPKEFREKNMVPRPDTIESFMLLFPFSLNSEAVGEQKTVLQFNFSGEIIGSCYFVIEQGNVDAGKGNKENPDITIETPFDLWMDIVTGKADGQQLFMEQKYTVNGDLKLMIQLFQKQSDR
jgi:multimeric flavodoxin WrbA/putative sterol carrier protein